MIENDKDRDWRCIVETVVVMECIKYAYKILTEYSLKVPIPQFLFVFGGGDGGCIPFSC